MKHLKSFESVDNYERYFVDFIDLGFKFIYWNSTVVLSKVFVFDDYRSGFTIKKVIYNTEMHKYTPDFFEITSSRTPFTLDQDYNISVPLLESIERVLKIENFTQANIEIRSDVRVLAKFESNIRITIDFI